MYVAGCGGNNGNVYKISVNFSNNPPTAGSTSIIVSSGSLPNWYPYDIVSYNNTLLVSMENNNTIVNYDLSGNTIQTLTNPTTANQCCGLTIASIKNTTYLFSIDSNIYSYYLSTLLVCFKEGTRILTSKGYVPIEQLRKGDFVETLLDGFVPVAMIGKKEIDHPVSEERIKNQLYRCSQAQYPELTEDLILTGCHSILVDQYANEKERNRTIEVNGDTYVTDRKYRLPACADERASVYEVPGKHTIYHVALENEDYFMNYGIYANGLLVESCSKRFLKEIANMKLLESE